MNYPSALDLEAYRLEKGRWVWDREAAGYRLLSNTEWEHAASFGRKTQYPGADNARLVAWFAANANGPQPVAQRMPNGAGLYDMSGNVWEWVWDGRSGIPLSTFFKETLGDKAALRSQRGGSFSDSEMW